MTFTKFLNFIQKLLLPKLYVEPISTGAAILGGAGISALGGLFGAKMTSDAAARAARASRFAPVGMESGIGTTLFQDGRFVSQLSPEQQALRDQLMGLGQQGLEQFQTFDPVAAGGLFTQQLNELAAPVERQNRLNLENRLFKQGLLGATTGQQRQSSLDTAQAIAQGQRDLTGLSQGQQQQGRLFNQALGALQAGSAIDQSLSNQVQQAIAASGGQTTANTNAARFQFQAGQSNADALAGFFGNLGQTYSQYSQPAPPPSPLFQASPQTSLFQAPQLPAYNIDPYKYGSP